ncbi:transcriptional regulator, RpiR family [Clostridiales bacterium oral taxon 876 str. F0540]|nr:transcriptional regulator, RpiR family [Clostridiales bacterium oral taxon 876 str. F0540]
MSEANVLSYPVPKEASALDYPLFRLKGENFMPDDNKGCLDRIKETYTSLNTAEKKVAQYILENPKEIIHISITELADNSSASETTVFRLCNKLGYKGYQDLKINLAAAIVDPIENIYEEIKENDDMYILMHKIMASNIYSIENTFKINKSSELEKAVSMILKAQRIMFFGMGGSGIIAQDAHHKFLRTGLNCVSASDSHWQAMYASMSNENDVIIAFSNSGSNKELIETINLARQKRINIISITSNAKSPISKVSDITLVCYGNESMFRSEAMESRITSLALIDCLYVGVAIKRKAETLKSLEDMRRGIALKRF